MSRSAKLREERRIQREEAMVLEAARKKKQKVVLSITIATVSVILAAVIALVCVVSVNNYNTWVKDQPDTLRQTVMMETENVKIDGMMMSYFVYSSYQQNLSDYGDSLGINTGKSLKEQYFNEKYSWFDYFCLEAQYDLRQIMVLAEKAKELGITLTDDEKKEIEDYLKESDLSAYTNAINVNADDLRKVIELTELASKMYEKSVEDLKLTYADFEKYFKDNINYFKTFDYKTISIPYGVNGWFDTAANAKAAAEVFKKVTTSKEFDECLTSLVTTLGGTADDAKQEVSDALHNDATYTKDDKFCEWAFAADRKALDIYINDTGSAYEVYLLTVLPSVPEVERRDVRHILLSAETCETDEKAKAKAEELLAEWKKGDKTAESFGKLAEKYTEDTGSATNGGLYENVSEGEMTEEFDEWLFAKNRKVGDAEIVKTTYGYHIMYYVGESKEDWLLRAESALTAEKMDALYAEYEKKWPITENNDLLANIPM